MAKMTLKVLDHSADRVRRSIFEVLGIEDTGASPTGSTFYKNFQICPREWALRHVAGLQAEVIAEQLTIGWLYHHCLEKYYRAIWEHQKATPNRPSDPDWLWGGAQKGAADAYAPLDILANEPGYAETSAVTRRVLDAYFEQYDRQDRWRILAVEETLTCKAAGFTYSARLDLVIEDFERGGLFNVEHKTARSITPELLDNYQLDLQVLGQAWLVQHCIDPKSYPPFRGNRINIATKGGKVRGPELHRHDVMPSPAHLRAFEATVLAHPHMRKAAAAVGYPQYFGHCSGYARGYSRCDFYDLCHNHPEVSVAEWTGLAPPDGYEKKALPGQVDPAQRRTGR